MLILAIGNKSAVQTLYQSCHPRHSCLYTIGFAQELKTVYMVPHGGMLLVHCD